MNNFSAIAQQSVFTLHDFIKEVFHQENSTSLAPLANSFADDFSMVTLTGKQLHRQQVIDFFSEQQGKRPSLLIEICNVQVLSQDMQHVWLCYQENQSSTEGDTQRLSTACIVIDNNGTWRWRYLQETAIA